MGWEDSNLRMTESKSVDLPTCRHPNGDLNERVNYEKEADQATDFSRC